MAHESFEDPAIANMMNDRFIPIKVDREERPDIDAIYQSALAMMGEQGGWPLTMFLTPKGEPFWGGTYYPPEDRYGRPGFPRVLQSLSTTYSEDPDGIAKNVGALRKGLSRLEKSMPGTFPTTDLQNRIAERLLQEFDPVNGGIGGAPKFPQGPVLALIWRAALRTKKEEAPPPFAEAVRKTMLHICQGGIYDHLGGGIARYSVDARWLVPHFEKMLYDNAQLVDLACDLWRAEHDPSLKALWETRLTETITWMVSDLAQDQPGFASARDADSEGEEGKFYVWSFDEVEDILLAGLGPDRAEDVALFRAYYDVSQEGNWESSNILNRLLSLDLLPSAEDAARLQECRELLFNARKKRIPPQKDTKVLADWNGLAIHAIAKAALTFGDQSWLDAAQAAFDFITENLNAQNGRLYHSWAEGRAQHAGMLSDYASMARAALTLYEATQEQAYLDFSVLWRDTIDRHFSDPESGGYFNTADDASDLIIRLRTATDTAEPAGLGLLVETDTRLWLLTGKDAHRENAEQTVEAYAGALQTNFFPYATLLASADFLAAPTQVILHRGKDPNKAQILKQAVFQTPLRNAVYAEVDAETSLPLEHPAQAAAASRAEATAPAIFLCQEGRCSLPMETLAQFETHL